MLASRCSFSPRGEKFVSCGIFFKLSRDWKNLYGGDSYAIKAASHELKGEFITLDDESASDA